MNDLYLKLTSEQKALLLVLHQQRCEEQLSAQFSDPALDAKTLRSVVHLQGQTHMLQYLLDFDRLLEEQKEQEKRDLLQSNDDPQIR